MAQPSSEIFASGRHVPKPYRVTVQGRSVRVGRYLVFSMDPPRRRATLRNRRARFLSRLARKFDDWRIQGGEPFAVSKLSALLGSQPDVQSFKISAGAVQVSFGDGYTEEVLLQQPDVRRGPSEAEIIGERLRADVALAATVLLGHGYYVSLPASFANVIRSKLLAIARSKEPQQQREADLLRVAGELAMADEVLRRR